MKLSQGQTWKLDQQFIRIARLERLSVEYKIIRDLLTKQGEHHQATKKEFCKLIKNATLLSADQVAAARDINTEQLSEKDIATS